MRIAVFHDVQCPDHAQYVLFCGVLLLCRRFEDRLAHPAG
jgi:hypothetical protein